MFQIQNSVPGVLWSLFHDVMSIFLLNSGLVTWVMVTYLRVIKQESVLTMLLHDHTAEVTSVHISDTGHRQFTWGFWTFRAGECDTRILTSAKCILFHIWEFLTISACLLSVVYEVDDDSTRIGQERVRGILRTHQFAGTTRDRRAHMALQSTFRHRETMMSSSMTNLNTVAHSQQRAPGSHPKSVGGGAQARKRSFCSYSGSRL